MPRLSHDSGKWELVLASTHRERDESHHADIRPSVTEPGVFAVAGGEIGVGIGVLTIVVLTNVVGLVPRRLG